MSSFQHLSSSFCIVLRWYHVITPFARNDRLT